MGGLSIWHWMIVLVVIMLLFGTGKVSNLMGDFAKGIKSFKKNMAEDDVSMEATAERPAGSIGAPTMVSPGVAPGATTVPPVAPVTASDLPRAELMATSAAPLSLSALLGGHDHAVAPDDDAAAAAIPAAATRAIIQAGERLDQRGWVPATSGNISLRLPDGRIAITRSGCHKGFLADADVMLVDSDGAALSEGRPSAETLLHCQIYHAQPAAGAVLHSHSVAATVLSMRLPGSIVLSDYEVMKAFAGIRSHAVHVEIPVFDNDQDIPRLAQTIAPHFVGGMPGGYVIRGHGAYAWGPDMPTALARLEALEFLLACELESMRLR